MPRLLLGLRWPLLLLPALLAASLVVVGCSQANGDRCEVDRDCSSGFCSKATSDPQNGICCDPNNTQTCVVPGATGGAIGSLGGSTGQGGSGGAQADASPDGVSSLDGSDDVASTD